MAPASMSIRLSALRYKSLTTANHSNFRTTSAFMGQVRPRSDGPDQGRSRGRPRKQSKGYWFGAGRFKEQTNSLATTFDEPSGPELQPADLVFEEVADGLTSPVPVTEVTPQPNPTLAPTLASEDAYLLRVQELEARVAELHQAQVVKEKGKYKKRKERSHKFDPLQSLPANATRSQKAARRAQSGRGVASIKRFLERTFNSPAARADYLVDFLKRNDQASLLHALTERTGEEKRVAQAIVRKIESFWTVQRGLAIKTRSGLSRRRYIYLTQALGSVYNPSVQKYVKQTLLKGVNFPQLSKNANEKTVWAEAERIFNESNPEQSFDGKVVSIDIRNVVRRQLDAKEKEGEPISDHVILVNGER